MSPETRFGPDALIALTHATTGGARLYALNPAAASAGLETGQALADAKALRPVLKTLPADPEGDRTTLTGLARWCGRYSPWTAPDPGAPGEDGVLLDITGCERLFRGEDRQVSGLVSDIRKLGFTAHAAAAPTIGLAWALARFAAPKTAEGWLSAPHHGGAAEHALDRLPVSALRIGECAAKLRCFGLERVRQLRALPRAQLTRRFGPQLALRIDQALGRAGESLSPLQPQTRFRARMRFAEALLMLDSLKQAVREAADMVCAQLEEEGQGLRRVLLTLYRVDGKSFGVSAGTAAPARDPAHIARLINEKLDRAAIDIGFGVDMVELCAPAAETMGDAQPGLVEAGRTDPGAVIRLTDRLTARLGETAVKRAGFRESHRPERASGWRAGNAAPQSAPETQRERPLLVLTRPEPAEAVAEIPDGPPRSFTWRRVRHLVAAAEGPERIAPEWWRERAAPRTRDYFRVETTEGRRFWLYREGLYLLETRDPQWFVHGAS